MTRRTSFRIGLSLLWPLALAACSVNPRVDLAQLGDANSSRVALNAPFFPQTENQCGPAALASVLSASGAGTTPDELSPQVYLPAREGSLQVELRAAARRAGRVPFVLEPRMDALLAELDRGRPVLVLQNLGTRSHPVWHYAVLTGYDRPRNELRINSGERKDHWVRAPRWLRTWDWGGRWALVTLRPGELPVEATTETAVRRAMQSLADFETVAGAGPALPSWRAASRRWPVRPEPNLALGNLAYSNGRLAEAADWYSRGLTHHPDNRALANNLASVLGEAGCARRGEALLRPVADRLDEGDAWGPSISTTLGELARQPGADAAYCGGFGSSPTPWTPVGGRAAYSARRPSEDQYE